MSDDVKHLVAETEQERARSLQASVDAAFTLSKATGCSIGEAILTLQGSPSQTTAAVRATDLATTTFAALCEDSARMNDVVLGVMTEKRLSYMDALGFLLDAHDEAASRVFGDERDTVTLSAVLADSGVSMARVMTLVAEQEGARTLAAPSRGMVKREIDGWGRVARPLGTDLDALLADPLAVRQDFRSARDAELVADDGIAEPDDSPEFATWESTWRSFVNQGCDLLQTLQLREDERQAELKAQRQVAEIEQKVQDERITAARKQRELAAQLVDDAKRLER